MVLSDLLNNEMGHRYVIKGDYVPFMFRALVYAVDLTGGRLSNPDAYSPTAVPIEQTIVVDEEVINYKAMPSYSEVPNPPDSLRARIIIDNQNIAFLDEDLPTYWPLFPGLAAPSPGDLVYVVFEDREKFHGLWFAKVPFDNKNTTPNSKPFSSVVKSCHTATSLVQSVPFANDPALPSDSPVMSWPTDQKSLADLWPSVNRNYVEIK